MTKSELRAKIKSLAPTAYAAVQKAEATAIEYDELTKFPELKDVIVDLLGHDYAKFIEGIDWVAPKPTTFRINLLNGESFYLVYTQRTWIAEVEGKKYYLLNLNEEQNATNAIARMLRYGATSEETEAVDVDGAEDISVETETDVEA
tara:strand:+ start:178 stop:618 length:441 start_codon:yes stop_codon:yes gene_type:complete